MTQALTDQRQCLISPESLLELKRQHRRLRGLISQLENEPQTPANHMTILDLDEIQSQIARQISIIESGAEHLIIKGAFLTRPILC